MSVTQYIGARYVPLFADPIEWDITKEYEPLTIVTYQGNSYTSRQAVPTNINITDENYWAITGNYNAQVEAYRREVRAFDGRITANAEAIQTETGARVDAIAAEALARVDAIAAEALARETADTALGERIDDDIETEALARETADTALGERIDAIRPTNNIYDYFRNSNVVFIGDSYTYGTGASDHGSGDTKRFSSMLAAWLDATEFNFGVGSTGFCDPGSNGQNAPFKKQVLTAANSMTQDERENTHLVVIAGGLNDWREGTTYGFSAMEQGAYDAAKNAMMNFPNALILTVPMLFNGGRSTNSDDPDGLDPRVLNFENAICSGVGASWEPTDSGTPIPYPRSVYIKGAWTWNFGNAGNFASDKLHPNDKGHRTIAAAIYSHILGGDAYIDQLCTITWESGFGGSVKQGSYLHLFNGMIMSFGMVINGSIGAGELIKIGTVAPAAYPLQNIIIPIMKSNAQAGIAIITNSGSLYIRNNTTSAITAPYIGPFNYIPTGYIGN